MPARYLKAQAGYDKAETLIAYIPSCAFTSLVKQKTLKYGEFFFFRDLVRNNLQQMSTFSGEAALPFTLLPPFSMAVNFKWKEYAFLFSH